eukprot:3990628-Amphidinium_carterae.1
MSWPEMTATGKTHMVGFSKVDRSLECLLPHTKLAHAIPSKQTATRRHSFPSMAFHNDPTNPSQIRQLTKWRSKCEKGEAF